MAGTRQHQDRLRESLPPLSTNLSNSTPRFSWQVPIEIGQPPKLSIKTSDVVPLAPPQYSLIMQRSSREQSQEGTIGEANRYSYLHTPVEMQEPFFPPTQPRQQLHAIPQSPNSPGAHSAAHLQLRQRSDPSQPQHPNGSQIPRTVSPYTVSDPAATSPANFAHVSGAITSRQQYDRQQPRQAQVYDQPAAETKGDPHTARAYNESASQLALKTERDDPTDKKRRESQSSAIQSPYTPHSAYPLPPRPVFNPDAPTPPPHQPGQIAHPNMNTDTSTGEKQQWKHSLCECSADVGTCLAGLCVPCVLYGKTNHRLEQKTSKKDPTDMLGWQKANGSCAMMAVLCPLSCMFPIFTRTRIRHTYNLAGSLGGDVLHACCCCCCTLVQNEREVRSREESVRRWAGPARGYEAPAQMSYFPPPQG